MSSQQFSLQKLSQQPNRNQILKNTTEEDQKNESRKQNMKSEFENIEVEQ